MPAAVDIAGWALYVAVVLYAILGLIYIWRAARSGGSVTQMGLFQWVMSVTSVIVFGITEVHKLHILWVVPVSFILSFTPIGRAIGTIVGLVMAVIFGRNSAI